MFLSSFLIIGTTSAYIKNIDTIKREAGSLSYTETFYDLYVLSQNLGALICGLLGYFFRFEYNRFIFGTVGAGFAIFAFVINLFFNQLQLETICIGIAAGFWWMIAPLIVYEFFGPKPFAGVWGSILTVNFWGMFICGMIFSLFWNETTHGLWYCFFVYCVFSIIAIVTLGYVLSKEKKR